MDRFAVLRQDLESMWIDIDNLFNIVDNDIIETLNRYPAIPEDITHINDINSSSSNPTITSLNNGIMQTIPEESPANHSNISIPFSGHGNSQKSQSDQDIDSKQNENALIKQRRVINTDLFFIDNNYEIDKQKNNLLDTISMQRIIYILSEYNKWLSLQNDSDIDGYDGMYDFINNYLGNGTYSIYKLLNDFHFIIFNKMDIDNQFDAIYEFLCDFIEKQSMNKRSSILNEHYFECDQYEQCHTDIQRENFYGKYWNDSKEIITLQILNKIYFYFLHSFDIGYRLNINEKQYILQRMSNNKQKEEEIDYEIVEITRIILEKRKKLKIINNNNNKIRYNDKYMIDGEHIDINGDNNDNNNDDDKICKFGYKYFYWFEYTNNAWFIYSKYSSIKDELLSNNIYHITPNQWNDLSEEAKNYQNCIYCKEMNKYQNINSDSFIHIEHIMAILLYTNFNILRHYFLKTFYRKKDIEKQEKESNLALKSRHSNYAIFGRLLNEAVSWFGNKVNVEIDEFYHIINASKILFNSTTTKICIPFSTSTNYNVILNKNIEINNKNGMILKIKATTRNTRYFNTCFLSKFVNEEEAFFIGGDNYLIFDDIINYKIGYKYNIFLKALNIIYTLFIGDWYKSINAINDRLKKLVQKLILYQLSLSNSTNIIEINQELIPEYIRKLLYFYCTNINEIIINWTSLNQQKHKKYKNWNGFLFLQNLFCDNECLWIKLNILYFLFPNMVLLKIITTRYSNFYLSPFILDEILLFVSKHRNECKLNQIIIKKPIESRMSIQNAIDRYYQQFRRINWNIKQIQDKWNDKYLIIHKM